MHATVYLHPLRTIAMHWESVDGVHTLVNYVEDDAVDMVTGLRGDGVTGLRELLCAGAESTTVIVHTDSIRFHSFPVEQDEDTSERLAFELQEFLPDADSKTDRVSLMPHAGLAYDTAWMSLTDIPQQICQNILHAFGSSTRIITDIESDIQALESEGRCILAGLRGTWIWVATVAPSQAPYHIERVALIENADLATSIADAIAEHIATLSTHWNSIVLFGDAVTPDLINAVAQTPVAKGRTVQRANAFHLVRANVDKDVQTKVIKRAHILSSMVGAIPE